MFLRATCGSILRALSPDRRLDVFVGICDCDGELQLVVVLCVRAAVIGGSWGRTIVMDNIVGFGDVAAGAWMIIGGRENFYRVYAKWTRRTRLFLESRLDSYPLSNWWLR